MRPTEPLAWFLTWHTFGTWLHGDPRGSDRRSPNRPELLCPDDDLRLTRANLRRHGPFVLTPGMRRVVGNAIRELAAERGWAVLALNVRTNHVHIIVGSSVTAERTMTDLKARCTRVLRRAGLVPPAGRVWVRHGSTRYLWTEGDVDSACHYVIHEQVKVMEPDGG